MPEKKKNAFISHSSKNDHFVGELETILTKLGYEYVFNDVHSIAAGDPIVASIETAIETTDLFVAILSQPAIESEWFEWECKLACHYQREMLVYKVDDCEIPDYLSHLDVADLRPEARGGPQIAPSRIQKPRPGPPLRP